MIVLIRHSPTATANPAVDVHFRPKMNEPSNLETSILSRNPERGMLTNSPNRYRPSRRALLVGLLVCEFTYGGVWPDSARAFELDKDMPVVTVGPIDQPAIESQVAPTPYTLTDVMQWAYEYSPAASLINSEAIAVRRGINTEDSDGCCEARLVQGVLQEVALARRSDSATEAAIAYHKLVAATQAVEFASQAVAIQDKLIGLAAEAERLDIPDANPLTLRQTRLDLVDLQTEQTFNALKLRQELSRLTGRSESEVAVAIMMDPLPSDAPSIAAGEAVSQAFRQRHDLRALQVLCRDLNRCNLDAARLMMGTLSPGAGLSLAVAATGLLKCLKTDTTDNDFQARRRQCAELLESVQSVVRNETLQAVLDVRSAGARLQIVDEQLQFATERLEEARGKIQIDEATPGSDLIVELEIYQLRGKRLARQKDLAIAIDNLHHASGAPLQ